MTRTAFAHVGLNCRNIKATEAFYARHFGFRRVRTVPLGDGAEIVFLRAGDVRLELFQAAGDGRPVERDGPPEAGFRHLAFAVDDLEATLREIGADAVVTLGPAHFDAVIPGWAGAWLRDPDGRIVEIAQGYRDEEDKA